MTGNVRLFLVGAIGGTLFDQIHVRAGVLSYPSPLIPLPGGQPIWVPLLFGAAALVLVYLYRPVVDFLGARDPAPPVSSLVRAVVGFMLAYASTGLFHQYELLLAAALLIAWSWHAAQHPGEGTIPYSLAVAVGGTLFEAGLSSTGAFEYSSPDFFGVPIWLPALYLHVALLTRTIALRYFEGRNTGGA